MNCNVLCFRSFWAIALLLCVWAAASALAATVWRYLENPTFLVKYESVEGSQFPAVLLCPEIYFPDYKMDAFITEINFPPAFNKTYFRKILRQLAAFYSPDIVYRTKDLEVLQYVLDFNQIDVDTATRRMTASCEETIIRCRWLKEIVNCSSLFQMELTQYGYCCVFNGRSLRREMKEYGIHIRKPMKPKSTHSIGPQSGLMLVVNQTQMKNDIDLSYKWLVLQGGHYVDPTANGTPVSPGTEQWAGFTSEKFSIADDAQSLSDELRGCRMSDERLTYFPTYNKKYCLLECEMKRTLDRCRCVRLSHPLPPGTARCRPRKLLCAKHAAVPYGTDQCNCVPTCDTEYDTVVTTSFALSNHSKPNDRFYADLDYKNISVVRAFILHQQSKTFARRSYYITLNLFSQLGGVFNLFFGCSILTVFELCQLVWYACNARWCTRDKLSDPQKGLILPPAAMKIEKKIKFNNVLNKNRTSSRNCKGTKKANGKQVKKCLNKQNVVVVT